MISLNQVLDIINNNKYEDIKYKEEISNLCPYKEFRYIFKLKEGGVIVIEKYTIMKMGCLFAYQVRLYVPNEIKPIAVWRFENKKLDEYDLIKNIFENVKTKYIINKTEGYSKYFPQ